MAPDPRSSLPAPYRNPWRLLAEDLRAVGADLRLRLRELWRRNGEGGLWRPAGWPRSLASAFWPLLLAGVVALLLLAGWALGQRRPAAAPAVPSVPGPSRSREALAPPRSEPLPAPPPAEPPAELPSAEVPASAPMPAAVDQAAPQPPVDPKVARTLPEPEGASAEPPTADPLQELLRRPEAQGLVQAAEADAPSSTLRLQLQPAFLQQPLLEQQRSAERWQGWAQELGFEHLELRDSRAGLVARDALVGTGMIVLTSQGQN